MGFIQQRLWVCVHTCKHHDVLEVGANLVPATQVEQEGQRVDVCRSAQKHGQLQRPDRQGQAHNKTRRSRPPLRILVLFLISSHLISSLCDAQSHISCAAATLSARWAGLSRQHCRRKDTKAPMMNKGLKTCDWKEKSVRPM